MEEIVVRTPVEVKPTDYITFDMRPLNAFVGHMVWSPDEYDGPFEIVIEHLRRFEAEVLGSPEAYIGHEIDFILPSGSEGTYSGLRVYLDTMAILDHRSCGTITFLAEPITDPTPTIDKSEWPSWYDRCVRCNHRTKNGAQLCDDCAVDFPD